jgi:hypothetical protein
MRWLFHCIVDVSERRRRAVLTTVNGPGVSTNRSRSVRVRLAADRLTVTDMPSRDTCERAINEE